ncbi:carboxylesterase/lipase family protein [Altericroceibacterium xinjiangense]|uniref:carboxylesterase/lipase family protein n=1 Tax=Altericroceibacterium xinjiangense TaxID=762261 RepID=UPI000F7EC715|nr:carboxylesterase family protein [Altericroceibacterium xinjiangense]
MSGDNGVSRREVVKAGLAGAAMIAGARLSAQNNSQPASPRAGRYAGFVDRGVPAFLGIRYATAERFARPQPVPFQGETVRATQFGPIAPQAGMQDHVQSEDALYLNVWTPDADPRALRPVMVYFHGGAYTSGSVTDPLTHGPYLAAAQDVVVVSVNQRLNVLGYAWLAPYGERFADSGNLGQLDLITALRWVRDNIAAFGGDPSRVMVFGQSGGGAKIATLMAMPAARGLFHSAATMSGQQVTASGPGNARARMRAFWAELGLDEGDVESLLTLPVERLVEGLGATDPILGGRVYFGPVLDMTNLPRHPFWPNAAEQSVGIPMILGNTLHETRAFIDPRGEVLQGLDWSNVAERLASQIKVDLDPRWVVAQYRKQFPDFTPEQVFYAATTAGRSWPGQVIEAEERVRAGAEATWVYQLDRPSPVDPLRGAAHTDDLPYLFGTLDAPGSYSGTDERAREISRQMREGFAGLARTGRPGLDYWTNYTLPERATLVIGEEATRMVDDPRRWQRELWALAPYIQPGS